ncbi:hypothetical protein [Bacillus haynesii]|uniref:hypothetical protein n=1 Tax=Bacillus haynesii TaxID=1925021 RepID=UPI00227FB26C|nr:hypothetical protein [Bacillus haynesii]MCY8223043.1 hypothetical protein [Bacillus haynesii]
MFKRCQKSFHQGPLEIAKLFFAILIGAISYVNDSLDYSVYTLAGLSALYFAGSGYVTAFGPDFSV